MHQVFTQPSHRSRGRLLPRVLREMPRLRVLACTTASVLVLAGTMAAGQSAAQDSARAAGGDTAHVVAAGMPAAGSYTYTLVPDSSDDIKAAINTTVSPMNFIVRGIARGRLTKVNPLPHSLRLRLAADTVSVAFDNGDPVVTPLDGAVVPWYNALAKETDKAHVAIAGDTLRQTISASDGDRENAISFGDGGARLHLRVTVTSHRLPKPLVYQLLFRRDSAG